MIHHRLLSFAVAALICGAAVPAFAQETRQELVQKISVAQGIHGMFEQQLADQRESLRGYGAKLLIDMVAQSGGEATAKEKAAFERFVSRAAKALSAKELSDKWVASYGTDLSTSDLQEILKYYPSPIGKKDVAATKAAMKVFSAWLNTESQARTNLLVAELMKDLQPVKR